MVLVRPLASSLVQRDPQTVVSSTNTVVIQACDYTPSSPEGCCGFLSCLHRCRHPCLMDKDVGICSFPKSPFTYC